MNMQINSYEINKARLQDIQAQVSRVRQVYDGQKSNLRSKSSKRLIALYTFILSFGSR